MFTTSRGPPLGGPGPTAHSSTHIVNTSHPQLWELLCPCLQQSHGHSHIVTRTPAEPSTQLTASPCSRLQNALSGPRAVSLIWPLHPNNGSLLLTHIHTSITETNTPSSLHKSSPWRTSQDGLFTEPHREWSRGSDTIIHVEAQSSCLAHSVRLSFTQLPSFPVARYVPGAMLMQAPALEEPRPEDRQMHEEKNRRQSDKGNGGWGKITPKLKV